MPGITSASSLAAQSGDLGLITTDDNGNLASDGGALFREVGKNKAGIAVATAMQAPDLKGDERFGIALNVATFDGEAHGLAFTAAGVLATDVFHAGDRLSLNVGVGGGLANDMNGYRQNVFSARGGLQLTW